MGVVSIVCSVPLCTVLAMRSRVCHLDAVAHAALGGILGSMTLVAGKLLVADLRAQDATFLSLFGYSLVCMMVVPAHLYVLNRSFGRYSLVILSPASGALGLLANITTGFSLYNEVPVSASRFLTGVALLCSGVLVLCTKQPARADKVSEAVARDLHDAYSNLHPRRMSA